MTTNKAPWTQFPREHRDSRDGKAFPPSPVVRPYRVSWVVSSDVPGNFGWVYRTLFFATDAEAIEAAKRPMTAFSVSVSRVGSNGVIFSRKNNFKRRAAA